MHNELNSSASLKRIVLKHIQKTSTRSNVEVLNAEAMFFLCVTSLNTDFLIAVVQHNMQQELQF